MLTLQLVMQFFLMVTPVLVTSLTFITYGATREMTLSTALTTLALINALRNDFVSLPPVVTGISQWRTSAQRIEELLAQPEISIRPEADLSRPPCVKVANGLFRWGNPADAEAATYELSHIDIDISKPSLTVVLGTVASGKSTLASAILGEVPRVAGEVVLHGRVAYVPQQAWIINATLRDNILLGRPYDPKYFAQFVSLRRIQSPARRLP
jgi:ATP-binding cassette, subfamily C (CFTR/MRP), member 1